MALAVSIFQKVLLNRYVSCTTIVFRCRDVHLTGNLLANKIGTLEKGRWNKGDKGAQMPPRILAELEAKHFPSKDLVLLLPSDKSDPSWLKP